MKNISLHWLQGIFETVPYNSCKVTFLWCISRGPPENIILPGSNGKRCNRYAPERGATIGNSNDITLQLILISV